MFSASSETRDRNAPTNANQIRLQTSRIRQERRPIRYQLPARLSFRQGQRQLSADLPESLEDALDYEAARSGCTTSSVVTAALTQYLERPIHTVFQVSTSGALVAGVYDREVSVQTVLEHGNFCLGNRANLDGEMVIVDGHVY
jgi:hypothetical protein